MDTNKIIEKIFNFLDKVYNVIFCMSLGGILYQFFGVKQMFNLSLAIMFVIAVLGTILGIWIFVNKPNKENCIIKKSF